MFGFVSGNKSTVAKNQKKQCRMFGTALLIAGGAAVRERERERARESERVSERVSVCVCDAGCCLESKCLERCSPSMAGIGFVLLCPLPPQKKGVLERVEELPSPRL